MSEPVTLLDVARAAGVSPSTVSRILNGSAGVSEAKRAAVMEAIERLEFRPNLSARSLRQGRSMTIGVLTMDVESPFYGRAMKGIEAGLADTGYAPLIVSGHWNAAEEAERIQLLMARRVDGIVVLNGHLDAQRVLEFAGRQPMVMVGRELTGANLRSIKLDQAAGGQMATRHLLSMGHRRIAFIAGPSDHSDAIERLEGYRRAHTEAGLVPDPRLQVQGDFLEAGGLLAMNRLCDGGQTFTAVFCANDQTAYGARMALYRRGLRVPDDLSLVGYDDLPASAYLTPPLTTVRQPLHDMGLYAARALLHMMGHAVAPSEPPALELVMRETTRRI